MSQRRQDARKAAQDRRRQERREARQQVQRRRATTARAAGTSTTAPSPVAPAAKPGFFKRRVSIGPVTSTVQTLLISAVIAVVLIALVAYLVIEQLEPLPGTKFPTNGNQHVAPGEAHGAYFSNPPTSGWHYADIPAPGVYTRVVEPEGLGHFMEHGGVWVLYTCPEPCQELADQLADIVNRGIDRGNPVAVAPYPPQGREAPPQRINVIAWQYLLSMDEINRGAINEFIDRHACRYNPEGGGICGAVKGSTASPQTPESGGFNAITTSATAVATVPATAPAATPTPVPAGPAAPSPAATGTP
jgi:hypothetical protein